MDGQSARHGQMCEGGFSIEGGITQGIKLAMCVCVCVCVCEREREGVCMCVSMCVCVLACVSKGKWPSFQAALTPLSHDRRPHFTCNEGFSVSCLKSSCARACVRVCESVGERERERERERGSLPAAATVSD